MELYISNAGQEPIYAQITRQIQEKILSGELREGDALPSIRALARDLRISVITTMPGRGSFVAPQNPALHREQALTQVEEALSQAIAAARRGGVNLEEVTETLNLLWEE